MKPIHKFPLWLLVIPFLLLATTFVVLQLGADSLDDDEKNSVKHLVNFGERFTLEQTVNSVNRTSPEHVPGFHLQLSIWAEFVGLHFVALRAMSMLYFMLSVAMAFRLGRDLFSARHGIITAFIVAFSAFHMHYGHEIRMYELVVLETMVILWSYWRIVVSSKPTQWYHYILLLLFSIYGLYTHNLLVFPLASIGVYHLLCAPKTRQWIYVAGVEVVAAVAFLPWLPNILQGASGFEDLSSTAQTVPEILFNTIFVYSNGFWVAVLLLVGVAIWKFPRKHANFRYVITTFAVMVIAMLILNEIVSYIPSRRMRYTLIWFPSLALICSYSLMLVYQTYRWLMWSILAIWLAMLVWFSSSNEFNHFVNLERSQFHDHFPFHIVGEEIKNQYDDLLGRGGWLVFFDSEYIYQSNLLNYYETIYQRKIENLSYPLSEPQVDRLDKIDDNFPGFWFSYRTVDEPKLVDWQSGDRAKSLFDTYHNCLKAIDSDQVQLIYYADKRIPCELFSVENRIPVHFDNGYVLRHSIVENMEREVNVSLLWDNDDFVFDGSYGFSIQVFQDGEKVGQTDYPIDNFVTHTVVPLANTLEDTGVVYLIVYSSQDIKSVGGGTPTGGRFEREIEIGQIEATK